MGWDEFCSMHGDMQAFYQAVYEANNQMQAIQAKEQQKAADDASRRNS